MNIKIKRYGHKTIPFYFNANRLWEVIMNKARLFKARLFVVDENTFLSTIHNKIASIYVPDLSGKQWLKTVADIMADMLQIEIGDYIFLWKNKSAETSAKNCIYDREP